MYHLSEAKDGQDALGKFNNQTTDIMFVDWNMPNMSGIKLVRTLRGRPGKRVPIVMITTEGTMGKVEEALNDGGVDSYVVKPFTVDIIKQKLTPLFEKLTAERQKPAGFLGSSRTSSLNQSNNHRRK